MAIRNKRQPGTWSVVEAKARLDEVIDEVEDERPQTLVRNGDERATIVPIDEWSARNQRKKGTLAEFFHKSPLRGSGIVIERHPDTQMRDVDL
ncbi:MAG: type II toxin-antitoxin system Phd/YefM family antitoxin [Chloroflexota bacterium]|nr:type II toxin-antitoxin system Phd/YefM family antitoxin [Chloroflexota bacterium]